MIANFFGRLLALGFGIDVLAPDPVPYVDEIVMFLLSMSANNGVRPGAVAFTLLGGAIEVALRFP